MIEFYDLYLSEILGKPVYDAKGEKFGVVKDIAIVMGEVFPRISGLIIAYRKRRTSIVLPINYVNRLLKNKATTSVNKEDVRLRDLSDNELLLNRTIMDKQIVDTNGYKVVRVNDLKLSKLDNFVRLIAADIGITGMLRRIHLLKLVKWFARLFKRDLDENMVGWNVVEPLKTDLAKVKLRISHEKLEKIHPSDIAQIVSQVHLEERSAIFNALTDEVAAETLHELEPKVQVNIVDGLEPDKAADILENMPPDEAADVLGDLQEEKKRELLQLMKKEEAIEVIKLLKHPDETAGGLMTTEFITLKENFTAQATIDKLRELAPNAETIYYLYVVDTDERLVGVISLRDLIVANPDEIISNVMQTQVITAEADMTSKRVADDISKYNLLALPVLDKDRKVLGIITVDDVMDVVLPPISRRKSTRI